MDNTLLAGGEAVGGFPDSACVVMTRCGSGLGIRCPEGRDIVPLIGADGGENISKAGRRCTTFFIESRSFFLLREM